MHASFANRVVLPTKALADYYSPNTFQTRVVAHSAAWSDSSRHSDPDKLCPRQSRPVYELDHLKLISRGVFQL